MFPVFTFSLCTIAPVLLVLSLLQSLFSVHLHKKFDLLLLSRYGHLDEIWGLLREILPQFKLPELPSEKSADADLKPESAVPESGPADDTVSEQPAKDGKVG